MHQSKTRQGSPCTHLAQHELDPTKTILSASIGVTKKPGLCVRRSYEPSMQCRAGVGKPSRRRIQLLPNHRLLRQVSSGQVHGCQVGPGRGGDCCPCGHHPSVPHPSLQRHAHERSGCHCHCRGAASAGLWQRHLPLLGGFHTLLQAVWCTVTPQVVGASG